MPDGADSMCAWYGRFGQQWSQVSACGGGGAHHVVQVECIERALDGAGDLWPAGCVEWQFFDHVAEHIEVVDQRSDFGIEHRELGTLQ